MKYNHADMELLPLHLWKTKEADAHSIIYHFYDYTSLDMCRQLLRKWFEAAFAAGYAWEDTPANLLYFYERLETLLYGCWLLHTRSNGLTVKPNRNYATMSIKLSPLSERMAERAEVFKFLTPYEIQNPLSVLQQFFKQQDFYAWQRELHNWLEAGLGRQTITELNETRNLLPVMEQLYKLAEASCLINQAHLHELILRRSKKRLIK